MRYHGVVGYGLTVDRGNDVWSDDIIERTYYGEVLSVTRSMEQSDKVNEDIRLQNRVSILADAFAFENFIYIKYLSWTGSLWTVNSVDVKRPRLILSLGGIYDGRVPEIEVQPGS